MFGGGKNEVHGALEVLELTTVHYHPGDPLSVVFAYITLTPLIILVALVTLLLFKRDLRTATIFVGLLLNECLNYVLKKTIKEARPSTLRMRENDYGMPSSHAQFLFFFATYIFLALMSNRFVFYHKWWRSVYSLLAYTVAGAVAFSRIYLSYHTPFQVLVGSMIGILVGGAWFFFAETFLNPTLFPFIESLPIAQYFYIRDTSDLPDVMRFEYENVMKWKKSQVSKKRPSMGAAFSTKKGLLSTLKQKK